MLVSYGRKTLLKNTNRIIGDILEYLNIKTNIRHSTLEYIIKELGGQSDLSRSGIFEKAVRASQGIDWKSIPEFITELLVDYRNRNDIPVFTSYKVKCSEETNELLKGIIKEIMFQLELKVVQKQYLLQLLLGNYILYLKNQRIKLKFNNIIDEELSMPDMAKILVEMMLTDSKCKELEQISKILINWNRRKGEYEFKETIS